MTAEKEIINNMLISTGEAPVSTEDSMHPSAIQAKAWFDSNNKRFQQRGYWFNTEYKLKLSPDGDGKILLPEGTLKIDIVSHPNYYVKRGRYLYDPVSHTFEIQDAVYANIVVLIDADDLPPAALGYLSAKCVLDWYSHEGSGDKNTLARCTVELTQAKAALNDTELLEAKVNAFQSPMASTIISALPSRGWDRRPTNPRG